MEKEEGNIEEEECGAWDQNQGKLGQPCPHPNEAAQVTWRIETEFQILHFVAFLLLYLGIVSGNLLIITAIALDHHLHGPMYFFLMNLAIQDAGLVSIFIPKSMANSLMNTRYISYSGCVAQVFLYLFFISSNFSLLTVMAYDRYVAICSPLEYEMIMNRGAFLQIIAIVWITGFLYSLLHMRNCVDDS